MLKPRNMLLVFGRETSIRLHLLSKKFYVELFWWLREKKREREMNVMEDVDV